MDTEPRGQVQIGIAGKCAAVSGLRHRSQSRAARTLGASPEETGGEVRGEIEVENEEGCGDDGGDDQDPGEYGLDEWFELYACPLTVRFTQDKIHPFFYRRGPIVNVLPRIRPIMRATEEGGEAVVDLAPPFSPIHCLRKGEDLWSLDNRRLYALQLAAMELWPLRCRIRILYRDRLPRHKFKTQYRKFTTTTQGKSIKVCARYQHFDAWSWFDRAVEIEWYNYSAQLGTLLLVFEVMPVLGALLFRTGLTGLSSRTPLVVGFVLTFLVDFFRQRVPQMEKSISEHHVRAVVNGEVIPWGPCWRRFRKTLKTFSKVEDDQNAGPMSMLQISVNMAVVMMLLLPYVFAITHPQMRSYTFSVWLGVACVLTAQLGGSLRAAAARSADPDAADPLEGSSGADPPGDGAANEACDAAGAEAVRCQPSGDDCSPDAAAAHQET